VNNLDIDNDNLSADELYYRFLEQCHTDDEDSARMCEPRPDDEDTEFEDDPDPWDGDGTLRDALEDAGWRYAILIGITDPDEGFPLEVREDDARKYAHFIKKSSSGVAVWDCDEAAEFVSEVTGASREVSAKWLDFDWPA